MLNRGASGPALRLSWLVSGGTPLLDTAGQVALSTCPGRPDSQRQLGVDLRELLRQGVTSVLTLVEEPEMDLYGVVDLAAGLSRFGLRQLCFPIVDREPPTDLAATAALVTRLLRILGEGERLLIHCIGGWGRSGTIAAALLIHEGHDADQAIALVRAARHPFCVQTLSQEEFLRTYSAARAHLTRRFFLVPQPELKARLCGSSEERRLRITGLPSLSHGELRALLRRDPPRGDLVVLSCELYSGLVPDTVLIDRAHVVSPSQGLRPIPLGALAASAV